MDAQMDKELTESALLCKKTCNLALPSIMLICDCECARIAHVNIMQD